MIASTISTAYYRAKQPWREDRIWKELMRNFEEFNCRPKCQECSEVKKTKDCPKWLFKINADERQEQVIEERITDPIHLRREEAEATLKRIMGNKAGERDDK